MRIRRAFLPGVAPRVQVQGFPAPIGRARPLRLRGQLFAVERRKGLRIVERHIGDRVIGILVFPRLEWRRERPAFRYGKAEIIVILDGHFHLVDQKGGRVHRLTAQRDRARGYKYHILPEERRAQVVLKRKPSGAFRLRRIVPRLFLGALPVGVSLLHKRGRARDIRRARLARHLGQAHHLRQFSEAVRRGPLRFHGPRCRRRRGAERLAPFFGQPERARGNRQQQHRQHAARNLPPRHAPFR